MRGEFGNSVFELVYSLFMLAFGMGMIFVFLAVMAFFLFVFGYLFLLFFFPIFLGIFIGLFHQRKDSFKTVISEKDSKKLARIIDRIAKKTGLKKPHKIVITEGTDVAVTGFFTKTLIIGLVALKFMDENDLFAIFAHEYGHFAHKDTIFGYLIYRIQNFLEIQREINAQNIGLSFTILIYLPTWIVFYLLSRYYAVIGLWYRRRVEHRADAFAARITGRKEFANSLVKYAVVADIFDNIVPQHIAHHLQKGRRIINIYDYVRPLYCQKIIDVGVDKVLSQKSSWWHTHPSISERLEFLGVDSVEIGVRENPSPMLSNQAKYEKDASLLWAHKIACWMQYVAAMQRSQAE
ncbi:MAG: M48 family metallopeptidase [Candidatus Woesearchaeota archaeon]